MGVFLGSWYTGPIIDRVFGIASRAGILPPPPAEIQGQMINVDYVSMLTQAQKAAASGGIERLLQLSGDLLAAKPDIMDNIDTDFALDKYAELLNIDPKIIRSPDEVQAIRDDRAKQMAAQQQAEQIAALSQAGKNLSDTDVGGGVNALQAMGGVAP